MSDHRLLLALAASLLLAVSSVEAGKKRLSTEATEALLTAARERLSLDDEIGEPLLVTAELRFLFDENAPAGVYQFAATGADRWRSEMSLPGWRDGELRTDGRNWMWEADENQERLTLLADWVRQATEPARLLKWVRENRGRRIQVAGRQLVEITPSSGRGPVLLLDPRSAELVSWDDGATRFSFKGTREAGGRSWPATVTIWSNDRPVLQVTMAEPVRGTSVIPEGLFTPPADARERASGQVDGLEPPRVLHAPAPTYPKHLMRSRTAGTVLIRVVIDKQGRLRSPFVLSGAHPDLDASALAAVAKRLYEPGVIEGRTVEVVSTIRITFSLS